MLAVGFAPQAVFVGCLFALLRAGAFTGGGDWRRVLPPDLVEAAGLLSAVCAAAALLGLLLSPFQVRAVRVLEGYWDRWRRTAALADILTARQRRRWRSLRAAAEGASDATPRGGRARALNAPRHAADAARRLAALPPPEYLLPTALGNALRAGELRAGERYGLSTLASWPRIHPQISAPLAAAVSSARDMLDASVNLCYSFTACTGLLAPALYDEPRLWWLPAASLVAAAIAYKGAVVAAQTYSGLMNVVYDLHRFDLVRALHHPLPSRDDEEETFRRMSAMLEDGGVQLPYDHGPGGTGVADRDDQPRS
jgi:hypothetical protein